jgi:hypothetical protein
MSDSKTTHWTPDIDKIAEAIQMLDDLTGHKPSGLAMEAQAALVRIENRFHTLPLTPSYEEQT